MISSKVYCLDHCVGLSNAIRSIHYQLLAFVFNKEVDYPSYFSLANKDVPALVSWKDLLEYLEVRLLNFELTELNFISKYRLVCRYVAFLDQGELPGFIV